MQEYARFDCLGLVLFLVFYCSSSFFVRSKTELEKIFAKLIEVKRDYRTLGVVY